LTAEQQAAALEESPNSFIGMLERLVHVDPTIAARWPGFTGRDASQALSAREKLERVKKATVMRSRRKPIGKKR
jgi:hypothetical protein